MTSNGRLLVYTDVLPVNPAPNQRGDARSVSIIDDVAARDDTQRPGISSQLVQIESNLNVDGIALESHAICQNGATTDCCELTSTQVVQKQLS